MTPEQQDLLRRSVIIAAQPFHVNTEAFAKMPLEQAQNLVNELGNQVQALTTALQARRLEENQDRADICTWCQEPFPGGTYFARFPFELTPGAGDWRSIYSCRKGDCLARFNRAVDEIQKQLRIERGG